MEDLVLEEDLLDHLVRAADESGAAQRSRRVELRRASSAASRARGRSGSSLRRTAGRPRRPPALRGVGDVAVRIDADRQLRGVVAGAAAASR